MFVQSDCNEITYTVIKNLQWALVAYHYDKTDQYCLETKPKRRVTVYCGELRDI